MKSWLKDNDVEMYSTHNEGGSVVAVRFVRALENKIYKKNSKNIQKYQYPKMCILIQFLFSGKVMIIRLIAG